MLKNKYIIFLSVVIIISLLLLAIFDMPKNKSFDAETVLNRLLSEVNFAKDLENTSESALYMFSNLPSEVEITMYSSPIGQSADTIVLFKSYNKNNSNTIKESINKYLNSIKLQSQYYNQEEVAKIENAVIYTNDLYVLLCITNDVETVNKILN